MERFSLLINRDFGVSAPSDVIVTISDANPVTVEMMAKFQKAICEIYNLPSSRVLTVENFQNKL